NFFQELKLLGSPWGETARWMTDVLVWFVSMVTTKKRWLWRSQRTFGSNRKVLLLVPKKLYRAASSREPPLLVSISMAWLTIATVWSVPMAALGSGGIDALPLFRPASPGRSIPS